MYKERKAIEAAAFFLRKSEKKTMDYYDLVKLMYLADREQMRRKGRTITGDILWSLPWGPVLGSVLDSLRTESSPEWTRHIRTDGRTKRCALVEDAPPSALSRSDLSALGAAWDAFGHMDGPSLMSFARLLPEYTDTDGRVLISLEDLARGVGRSEDEIDSILAQDRESEAMERFMDAIEHPAVHA